MNSPNFEERVFKEHNQVLKSSKVPLTLEAYTHAGPEHRLLFKSNHVDLSGEDSTGINASYIRGAEQPDVYIATETPESQVGAQALWETIWKHQTHIVVMLNEPERGERAYLYWSPEVGTSLQFGKLTVSTVKISTIQPTLQITELEVTNEVGHSLTVYHFLYFNWHFHDVLPPTADFLKLLFTVRKYSESERAFGRHQNPILVHCSNGLDRTMVFCAIDRTLSEYVRTKRVNIYSTVASLMQERYNCLSDMHDYYFCYTTLYEYFVGRSLEL